MAFLTSSVAVAADVESLEADKSKLFELHWKRPFQPCDDDCYVGFYAGAFFATGFVDAFTFQVLAPDFDLDNDFIAAVTASRRILTAFDHFHIEIEVGAGQRFGQQHEQEFWFAPYLRFDGFPWNRYLHTSVAINTGLNYATGVSEVEEIRGGPAPGSRLLHFLSPELTLALPQLPDYQGTVRLHHRSGAFGVVSDSKGGSQYLTFGLRKRF
ncbi:MAG: hypothetical protein AAGE61_17730 [Pseudomonadota bacterium]